MTVAIQAAVMLALVLVLIGGPLREERYRALGARPAAVEPNAVAVFRSDATSQQMRDALDAAGASIVGGPTVTNAYLLRFKTNVGPEGLARLPGATRGCQRRGAAGRLIAMKFALLLVMLFLSAPGPRRRGRWRGFDSSVDSQQVLVLFQLPPPHFRADGNYAPRVCRRASGNVARRRLATSMARSNGLTLVDDWPLPILGVDCYVMAVPPSERPEEVAARLARDPRVAWAQPMHEFRALGHDDPLSACSSAAAEWRLSDMHAWATGRDVRVAVVDSGVQLDHPDLVGQIAAHASASRAIAARPAEAHGTAVAGIVAARRQPYRHRRDRARSALVGVAGGVAKSRPARRVLDRLPSPCTRRSIADAQVINLSLGGRSIA